MTAVYLVRHAHTDALGVRLSGRVGAISLSARGRNQARHLGRCFAAIDLDAIYTSPLPRAIETAAAIAAPHQLTPQPLDALHEIDFGRWSGRSFAELADDPRWHTFNHRRSHARIPGGEPLSQVQRRMVTAVRNLGRRHRGRQIVIVSHADVIRLALLAFASLRIDNYNAFTIAPASITTVLIDGAGCPRIDAVNATRPSAVDVSARAAMAGQNRRAGPRQ